MMGVHEVGARQHTRQIWRERMRRVTAEPHDRSQRAVAQTAGFAVKPRRSSERDQLAVDVAGEGSRELERVPLATAE
jgi:hypothetical protein